MLVFTALIAIFTLASNGTVSYDECKALKFEPKACWSSEQLYKAGKWSCKMHGKELGEKSECK